MSSYKRSDYQIVINEKLKILGLHTSHNSEGYCYRANDRKDYYTTEDHSVLVLREVHTGRSWPKVTACGHVGVVV